MVSPASLLYLSSFSFHIRFGNVVKWLKEILSTIITYLTTLPNLMWKEKLERYNKLAGETISQG
jgi:hypothetical protein